MSSYFIRPPFSPGPYTSAEVAGHLQIPESVVLQAFKTGALIGTEDEKEVVFEAADINAWRANCEVPAIAPGIPPFDSSL